MNITSTILTVGTALRHAEDDGARVHILLGGTWMTGSVLSVDGERVALQSADGDMTVVRIQAVNAVRVEKTAPAPAPVSTRALHQWGDTPPRSGWHPGGADLDQGHAGVSENLLARQLAALSDILTRAPTKT